jgi:hypothetical protein
MEDENGGLFNIEVSSEDEAETEPEKVPRDFQSEEDFQRQRAAWKPKIEVGEVRICPFFWLLCLFWANKAENPVQQLWKTLKLPIDKPSKPESQTILHAIEELYFFKRYEEALKIVQEALNGELISEFRKTLEDYKARCQNKLQKTTTS